MNKISIVNNLALVDKTYISLQPLIFHVVALDDYYRTEKVKVVGDCSAATKLGVFGFEIIYRKIL